MHGITVHMYGPHIFHTDREDVWDYVNRFADFYSYVHTVTARSGGREYVLPFTMTTFGQMWGVTTPAEAVEKLDSQRPMLGREPENLEEQAMSLVGRELFETLVRGYTEKQWGRACRELPASVIRRLPVRFTADDRYFTDRYQGIPKGGYNGLIEGLLAGIPVLTGVSYEDLAAARPDIAEKIVYTGTIDGFFGYSLGRLEYRSLRFETQVLEQPDFQGRAVVNYCDRDTPFTRIIEHRHFLGQAGSETVITREYPQPCVSGQEPYYPVEDDKNRALYRRYLALAETRPQVIFGGRLGEYRYYDMDDVIAAALERAAQEP